MGESNKMAEELNKILSNAAQVTGVSFKPAYQGENSFLQRIVTPIYHVLHKVYIHTPKF